MPIYRVGDDKPVIQRSVGGGATLTPVAGTLSVPATTDAATAALAGNPASLTGVALSAAYGVLVPIARLGGGTGKTAAQNRTAIQLGIDNGDPIFIPPGTYAVDGIVPAPGMRIAGAGKGDPDNTSVCTILRSASGPLFAGGATPVNYSSIQNIDLQCLGAGAGAVITGNWASTEFRNVRLRQYQAGQCVVDVTGWIDVVIDGASEIVGAEFATVPLFRAISATNQIAQVAFRDVRVTGGRNYQFWLEATGGGDSFIQGVEFSNINHELCNGGAIKLLSCRAVEIKRSGFWDRNDYSLKDMIYLGAGSGGGADCGAITIAECVRDASLPPNTGVYDIKAESGTFDLNIDNCMVHQSATAWKVDAGGANGRLTGTAPGTFDNGSGMDTDFFQTYTPTVTPTTQGNGTLTGKYQRHGKKVHVEITFTVGSTTTISGMQFTLPVPAIDGTLVTAQVLDSGVGYTFMPGVLLGGVAIMQSLGAGGVMGAVNGSTPITWSTSDQLVVSFTYIAS